MGNKKAEEGTKKETSGTQEALKKPQEGTRDSKRDAGAPDTNFCQAFGRLQALSVCPRARRRGCQEGAKKETHKLED